MNSGSRGYYHQTNPSQSIPSNNYPDSRNVNTIRSGRSTNELPQIVDSMNEVQQLRSQLNMLSKLVSVLIIWWKISFRKVFVRQVLNCVYEWTNEWMKMVRAMWSGSTSSRNSVNSKGFSSYGKVFLILGLEKEPGLILFVLSV